MGSDKLFLGLRRASVALLIGSVLLSVGLRLIIHPPSDSPPDMFVVAALDTMSLPAAGSEAEKSSPRSQWIRPGAMVTPDLGESGRLVERLVLQAGLRVPVCPPKERDPPTI